MAAARVSIPAAARRMIQDIKEIAGGHADEEVYAVLRECDMDPNETTQRLLARGTFHEVKRKRDKKKESRKEYADPRWRPGMQGRDVKGGQGNYSSRQLSNSSDLSGRKALAGKEIGVIQNMDKCGSRFVNRNMETVTSTSSSSLPGGLSNGPSQPVAPIEKISVAIGHLQTSDSKQSADLEDAEDVATSVPDVTQSIQPPPSISGLCTSAVDPIPSPSPEARSRGGICSTIHDLSAAAGVPEEWKSKSTNRPTQAENVTCEDVPVTVETVPQSVPVLNSIQKEDLSVKVDKRLSEMQLSDKQHVIIPNHLQVTESEKYGLSFGSFGSNFEQTVPKGPECEKSSSPPEDGASHELYEVVGELAISCQGASSSIHMEADRGVQQPSVDDSSPQRIDSGTSEVAGSDCERDSSAASHIPQDSVAQTTSDSTFALAPQIHGNQIRLPETSESQLQQGINSFVLPSSGSAPLATPSSGVVRSSIATPLKFRQPVPHYAPNFIPYNHYISPFYYPPHTLNHFMGNAAVFPQPPTESMYSSSYKPDDNTGSQMHVGIPGAYAIYGSGPSVYTNNVMVSSGTSVESDDVIGSQFKENTFYVAGQQSDGSTVWIPAPGRDLSALQSTSFYGLPPQGQHLAFFPAQAGHGAFGGIYHPAQAMAGPAAHPLQLSQTIAGAVEMVGSPPNGYQQPQHAQMNWGSY